MYLLLAQYVGEMNYSYKSFGIIYWKIEMVFDYMCTVASSCSVTRRVLSEIAYVIYEVAAMIQVKQ